jgi:hypothetical protein
MFEPVQVFRGRHAQEALFGPLPGVRHEGVVAYEFELPESYEPWPGRTLLERVYVLLDVGVSFADVCWARRTMPDGAVVDRTSDGDGTWYVDLITVGQDGDRYTFRDLYIDVLVPMDGRHYRMLDLDDFADAIESGQLSLTAAIDALRRWQRFLDQHLHADRGPLATWTDFPPAAIASLVSLPAFGNPVRAPG